MRARGHQNQMGIGASIEHAHLCLPPCGCAVVGPPCRRRAVT
uniref:Uncharacterized protein n=1 Tax=Arundo donax TaxID=35708 RepID=A0A0A9GMF4_ARUDO